MAEDQAKDMDANEATIDDRDATETARESGESTETSEATDATEATVTTDWEGLASSRYDQLIRLQADFENFRRRMDRERVEAEAQTISRMLSALLPVYDNLERAVRFMPNEGDAKAWRQGIEMTLKGFNEALERLGVEPVATVGERFDPRLHEAIQQAPSHLPEGIVAEELQKGFRWRERVLRAALVKVSTGPADTAAVGADSGDGTDFEA
jgi:molecular chaperone GrpE